MPDAWLVLAVLGALAAAVVAIVALARSIDDFKREAARRSREGS